MINQEYTPPGTIHRALTLIYSRHLYYSTVLNGKHTLYYVHAVE